MGGSVQKYAFAEFALDIEKGILRNHSGEIRDAKVVPQEYSVDAVVTDGAVGGGWPISTLSAFSDSVSRSPAISLQIAPT